MRPDTKKVIRKNLFRPFLLSVSVQGLCMLPSNMPQIGKLTMEWKNFYISENEVPVTDEVQIRFSEAAMEMLQKNMK